MRLTDADMEIVAYYAVHNNKVGLQNILMLPRMIT